MRNMRLTLSALALAASVSGAYAATNDTNQGMSGATAPKAHHATQRSRVEQRRMERRDMARRDQMGPSDNSVDGVNAPGYSGYGNPAPDASGYALSYGEPSPYNQGPFTPNYGPEGNAAPAYSGYGNPAPGAAPRPDVSYGSSDVDSAMAADAMDTPQYGPEGNAAPGYSGYGNPGPYPYAPSVAGAYPAYGADASSGYYGAGTPTDSRIVIGPIAASSPVNHRPEYGSSILAGPKGR